MVGSDADRRLKELGVVLPSPPIPLGAYVEATRCGSLLFLSGMLPVDRDDPKYSGRLGEELSIQDGYDAARSASLGGLAAAQEFLGSLNQIRSIAKLGVYIATPAGFREHPKVADGASELLLDVFGAGKVPPRIVLGVASIPLGLPVEIELIFEIEP
ncbi:RidA family protein [Phyllobacterium lublinensis]|uniref:RidA family protein n=1 Tax=Phyllobacterium lublinensis TaxID=2875708 RepID=UPI001CCE17D2|nr:RidA family protein [Phyllobacterium sp. 2063]MBZ9653636.1 RidA family protein [Phyllobacterium sp. 2063]